MNIYIEKWKDLFDKKYVEAVKEIKDASKKLTILNEDINRLDKFKSSMEVSKWLKEYDRIKEEQTDIMMTKQELEKIIKEMSNENFSYINFDIKIDGKPITIISDESKEKTRNSNGAIGKSEFKCQEELDEEYNINVKKLTKQIIENQIDLKSAEILKTKMFFIYANFIKHAPSNPNYQPKNDNQTFTIVKKEQPLTEAKKKKTISAIIAGACILGTIISVYINKEDITYAINKELKNINSIQDIKEFIKDIGAFAIICATSATVFITKHLKDIINYNKIKKEIENNNGGEENDKSR